MTSGPAGALPSALPTWSRSEQREYDCLLLKGQWEMEAGAAGAALCPYEWDRVHCWPPSPAGALAVTQCIDELNGIKYDTSQNATRWCLGDGSWANYSDYSRCLELLPPEAPAPDDLLRLACFLASYSLSLLALALAVSVFLYFKDLRCLRNTIHTNLMWTYIFYDATWILKACNVYPGDLVSCAFLAVLIHYFYLTNFFWMFVEGLYLFMLVVATFTSEKIKLRVYLVIGWGVPGVIVLTWAVAKHFGQSTAQGTAAGPKEESELRGHCPLMAPDLWDWIHQAPVIAVLAMNLVFLVSIMWVLITKLRSANTAETQQYRKATKALLVLFPLLGITYILMLQGPGEGTARDVFLTARDLFVGLQGFTVALFYCFLNTEVQHALRHRLGRWREARAVGGGRRYTLSHSKDWSPRSRTESIRLGDMSAAGGTLLSAGGGGGGGGFRKRESTASEATTTTLLGAGHLGNGRLSTDYGGGGGARLSVAYAHTLAVPAPATPPPPPLLAEENAV